MKFVDENYDVLRLLQFVHNGLDSFLELTTILGSRNHEGEIKRDHFLIKQIFRDQSRGNLLSKSLDNRGLSDPGLTDENGIVLGPPAEDLRHSTNFLFPADDRIHFPFLRNLRKIPAKRLEGRCFQILPLILQPRTSGNGSLGFFGRGKIRIQFGENFLPASINVDVQGLEDSCRNTLPFPEKSQQNMFGPYVTVVKGFGFLSRQSQNLFHSGGVRYVTRWFCFGSQTHLLVHSLPDRIQIKPHLLQYVDCHSLPKVYQPKQQMLGPHIVMMESIRFFSRKSKHLLGAGREITHWFGHKILI